MEDQLPVDGCVLSLCPCSPDGSALCRWQSEWPMREERMLGRAAATASALSPSSLDRTPASSSAPSVRKHSPTCDVSSPARSFWPEINGINEQDFIIVWPVDTKTRFLFLWGVFMEHFTDLSAVSVVCLQDADECVWCFRSSAAEAWSRNQRNQSRDRWWDPRERHQREFIHHKYTELCLVSSFLSCCQCFRWKCRVMSCVVCRRTSWWWSWGTWSRPTQRSASSSCRPPSTPPCSENTSSTPPSSRCSDAPSLFKVKMADSKTFIMNDVVSEASEAHCDVTEG